MRLRLIVTGGALVAGAVTAQLIRHSPTDQSTTRLPEVDIARPAVLDTQSRAQTHIFADVERNPAQTRIKMPQFAGKYKLDKSEKFDEYMKALGVGLATRKIGNMTSPTLTVTQDGDHFVWKSESTFKSQVVDFVVGQEYDFKTMDDRKVKCLVTWDGEKLKEVQKPLPGQEGKETILIREVDKDNNVLMTLYIDDVVCTRLYKRV
ncbi:fatty acid-binding protein, brain-like [Ptychodera flava]|uniref:fatty acid-binding protein, brain-like n=1 Tax=Ptychodera flava TaxID=63121 RepID=UPI003969E8BA